MFWILFSVAFLCIAFLSFRYLNKSTKPVSNDETTSMQTDQNTAETTIDTADASSTNTIEKSKIETIPIFMYHYVRDYSDTADPIGVNLSVSPKKLADQLDLLKKDGYTTITFNDLLTNNLPTKPVILTFDDGYKDFYQNAFPLFKERKMTAVSYVISDLLGKSQYMNSAETKLINDYGIEIGSHTLSHPDLTKISDNGVKSELSESKTALEAIIGKKIISFCYPSGKFSAIVEAEVKDAGYLYAVTTQTGVAKLNAPYLLSRYRMNADTNISNFLAK